LALETAHGTKFGEGALSITLKNKTTEPLDIHVPKGR
jgi:hypothetical protein